MSRITRRTFACTAAGLAVVGIAETARAGQNQPANRQDPRAKQPNQPKEPPTRFQIACMTQFGGLDQARILRSMELFGSEVIPALERELGPLDQLNMASRVQQPLAE